MIRIRQNLNGSRKVLMNTIEVSVLKIDFHGNFSINGECSVFFAPLSRGKKHTTPHFTEKIPIDVIKIFARDAGLIFQPNAPAYRLGGIYGCSN